MGEIIGNIVAVFAILAGSVVLPVLVILLIYRFIRMVGYIIRMVGYLIGAGFREALGRSLPMNGTPLQILEERYARGEIDHAEFEERRSHLFSSR